MRCNIKSQKVNSLFVKTVFLVALNVLTVLIFFVPPVKAQTTDSDSELTITLTQKVQNPENKNIEFVVVIDPQISSQRAQLTWQITGVSKFAENQQTAVNIILSKGVKQSYSIEVLPLTSGQSEIVAELEVFKVDKRSVISEQKIFFTNSAGEYLEIQSDGQLKIPSDYANLQTFIIIRNIIYVIAGLGLFALIGFVTVKLFIKWLNKNEVK